MVPRRGRQRPDRVGDEVEGSPPGGSRPRWGGALVFGGLPGPWIAADGRSVANSEERLVPRTEPFRSSQGHSGNQCVDGSQRLPGPGQSTLQGSGGPCIFLSKSHGLVGRDPFLDSTEFGRIPNRVGCSRPQFEHHGGRQSKPPSLSIHGGRKGDGLGPPVHEIDQETRIEQRSAGPSADAARDPPARPPGGPLRFRAREPRQDPTTACDE